MQYGRNNRRATLPWVTENGSARCDLTLLAKIVCRQLHRQRCYSRVSVPKPLITKMNAHLRVQWCKKNIDVGEKKAIRSDESSSPYFQQNVKMCVWCMSSKLYFQATVWSLQWGVPVSLFYIFAGMVYVQGPKMFSDTTFIQWWSYSILIEQRPYLRGHYICYYLHSHQISTQLNILMDY